MTDTKQRDHSFVAFAVAKSDLTQRENAKRAKAMGNHMEHNDIAFNKCIGSYKGQLENSFIISLESFEKLQDVIFKFLGQESVLVVDEHNNATLLYADAVREEIGELTKVGIQQAIENEDAFTIKGNHAYVVR